MWDSTPQTSHYSNAALTSDKLFDVSFATAVVTGGGTGIGLMIAQALQTNGATVYITGRRKEALDSVVKQYSTGPGKIIALPGDITKKKECLRLADEVGKLHPKGIHALVNNAGIARDDNTKFSSNGQPDMKSADAISEHLLKSETQQWADTFETNVTAQYFMSSAFIPLLAKGTQNTEGYSSCITNISSISGLMKGSSGGQFAYASSKASLVHLTRMLATTLMDVKIRVNQVSSTSPLVSRRCIEHREFGD
jgi:NAD(P)-dependent dehydrogenase (short-subunit alcohol dehydrogenase family)